MSIVSAVGDVALRSPLEIAEQHLKEDRIRDALIECAKAWDIIRDRQADLYSQSWLVSYGLPAGMPQVVSERIKAEVVHLHHQIRDLSGVMFAQTFGLNLVEYHFLRTLLPEILGTEIKFSAGVPEGVSLGMARRCVDLLARYAIRLGRELGAANSPAWNPVS